jgi:hypothetical protein
VSQSLLLIYCTTNCPLRGQFGMLDFGPGPWFAALLHEPLLQLSEIIVHTYPELIAVAINYNNRNKTHWTLALVVGPFSSLDLCKTYKAAWDRSKQLKTRLENGRKLYNKTSGKYSLWYCDNDNVPGSAGPGVVVAPEPFASVADFAELHQKRIVK